MGAQMTTIEVDQDTAEILMAKAKALRLSLDAYLRALAESAEIPEQAVLLTPQERARLWEAWAASHDPNTPVILDDSREAIYDDDGR